MNSKQKESVHLQNLICPECNNNFTSESELSAGKIVECPACVTECEVISVNPLKLAPLEEEK